MSNDVLETLLLQLAGMKHAAQTMVAREYPPDAEFDWDGDHRIWLGMNETDDGEWVCGWLIQPGAYAYMAVQANGRTPIEAALALRRKMIEGTP